MRLITVFGAGLLLGAALAIVIPEGVDALYRASGPHAHNSMERTKHKDQVSLVRDKREADVAPVAAILPQVPEAPGQQPIPDQHPDGIQPKSAETDPHDHSWFSFSGVHQQVGITLLVGYLFMLAVDHFSSPFLEWLCCHRCLPRLMCCCRSAQPTTNGSSNGASQTEPKRITVTFGLVIHSLADGLAIGSAFALDQLQLEIILFLAIILHKAPAAFGLACFLLHEGFNRDQIRCHLVAFASAAPIAAFLTYFYLILPSPLASDVNSSGMKTGLALLLSGGTFLYVAASHILPEIIYSHRPDGKGNMSSPTNSESRQSSDYTVYNVATSAPIIAYPSESGHMLSSTPKLTALELLILSMGAIIPLILSSTHSH